MPRPSLPPQQAFVLTLPLLPSHSRLSTSAFAPQRPLLAPRLPSARCARRQAPSAQARRPGGGGPGGLPPPQQLADYILRAGRFLSSSRGQTLLWIGLIWLVVSGRAGFIFDSIFFLFILFTVVPTVGIFAFRWWVSSQTVEGSCPNCSASVSGLKGKPFQCMSCGQVVKGDKNGNFAWGTEPSSATIDVDAEVVDVEID